MMIIGGLGAQAFCLHFFADRRSEKQQASCLRSRDIIP
jgi:hypothetical protein